MAPSEQNSGVAKLLISSIFSVVPEGRRIFLCTRVTNENALKAYRSWGFTPDLNPTQDAHYTFNLEHWTFLEYKADRANVLQAIAAGLVG